MSKGLGDWGLEGARGWRRGGLEPEGTGRTFRRSLGHLDGHTDGLTKIPPLLFSYIALLEAKILGSINSKMTTSFKP